MSISTKANITRRRSWRQGRPALRPGTAEVELLLSMMLLMTIYFLIYSSGQIFRARIDVWQNSHHEVFGSATSPVPGIPNPLSSLRKVKIFNSRWPKTKLFNDYPLNQTPTGSDERTVPVYGGVGGRLRPARLKSYSGMGGVPTWTWMGTPSPIYAPKVKRWYRDTVKQAITQSVIRSLKLADIE